MNCNKCYAKYNTNDLKPQILWPCCHTFCSRCLSELKEQQCPDCSKQIIDKQINYLGLDLLDQNKFMKETISEQLNKLNQTSKLFLLNHNKKNDDIQAKLAEIESSIQIQTNEKIDILLRNQNDLLYQVRNHGTQINIKLKQILTNEQQIELKIDELKSNLNSYEFIQNKFNTFTQDLKTFETKLDLKLNEINHIDLDFNFKANNSINSTTENNVGSIFDKKQQQEPVKRTSNELQHSKSDTTIIEEAIKRKKTEYDVIQKVLTPVKHQAGANRSTSAVIKQGIPVEDLKNKEAAVSQNWTITNLNISGKLSRTKGELKTALELFDKAIKLDPNYAQSYKNKAFALTDLKEYEKAIECYDQAIRINANDPSCYFYKGNIYFAMKKLELSLECFNRAISLNPAFVKAYRSRDNVIKEMKI